MFPKERIFIIEHMMCFQKKMKLNLFSNEE